MNAPGQIALRAIQDAELPQTLSVREKGNNAGVYVETYLHSVGLSKGDPWCAAFVYYRLSQAAKELGKSLPNGFPKSGYCPDFKDWGKDNGLWIPASNWTQAKRGDLVLYYFSAKERVAHIGLVSSVGSSEFITVEGNTGASSSVNPVNRDGDGVYMKHRNKSMLGTYGGFVRFPY